MKRFRCSSCNELGRMQLPPSPDTIAQCLPVSADSHPHAWMVRRLRVTLGITVLLLLVQTVSAVSEKTKPASVKKTSALATLDNSMGSGPRAVLPAGWRRTADGWQHVSTWKESPIKRLSLSQLVLAQRDAEPFWLRQATEYLRRTPPGCFALAQLLCVGLLFIFFRQPVTKRVTGCGDTLPVSQTWLSR